MKNYLRLAVFFACTLLAYPVFAQDIEYKAAYEDENTVAFDEAQKKLILPFAGKDKEEGMLELFVGNNSEEALASTPVGNDLNSIAPAAGVQFRLEF